VFDSGVGGLTVLRETIKAVPDESTIYFGDTERFPYGPRDLGEVKRLAFKITRFLYDKDIKLIVIACNTAAAAALKDIKKKYNDIPVNQGNKLCSGDCQGCKESAFRKRNFCRERQ